MTFQSRASFLMVGIWCLMAIVLSNGYAGTLLSFLSTTKLEPVINSIQELTNSDILLSTQDQTDLVKQFLVSTSRDCTYKM